MLNEVEKQKALQIAIEQDVLEAIAEQEQKRKGILATLPERIEDLGD